MVAVAEATVSTARAGVTSTQPEVEQTALERKRQEALLASKATTRQQLESAVANAGQSSGMLASREADVERAQADLERAQASLASSRAQLEAEKRELAALDSRDAVYKADILVKRAAITVAEVNLAYTRITSPTNGSVGERHVQEGQLVTPGMEIIDLVKGDPWIQANYLETQITNIRKGDKADIKIDAFPGFVLHQRHRTATTFDADVQGPRGQPRRDSRH